MKKKVVLILFIFLVIIGIIGGLYVHKSNQKYTYEWVEVEDSSIGQYMLYVNNSRGKHVDGTVRLVYINGETKKVEVDKDGLLYLKSIVLEVRNPQKR